MSKIKFRPIRPDDRDVAQLRERLKELVRRLRADYDRYLKPLVLKMSREERKEAAERQKNASAIFEQLVSKSDSIQYLTVPEFALRAGVSMYRVRKAISQNEISGIVKGPNGADMIPEDQLGVLREVMQGGYDYDEMDIFNVRLAQLAKKYEGLFGTYKKIASTTIKRIFKKSANSFVRQFKNHISVDILKIINEEGMEDLLKGSIEECTNLIKTIPSEFFQKIQEAVFANMTGADWDYEGGLQKYIYDLGSVTIDRARIIARDQTMKAVSTFTRGRLENCGVTHYVWRASMDGRTAGNPKGLYPQTSKFKLKYVKLKDGRWLYKSAGTDKSKFHGNHWNREGKIFSWNNPPPDGHPGMGICCRCYAEPLFEKIEDDEK